MPRNRFAGDDQADAGATGPPRALPPPRVANRTPFEKDIAKVISAGDENILD